MSSEIRIYVADLTAYNNGILHGLWIDATKDIKDVLADVQAMLAYSPKENAEEYAIHNYEGFGTVELSEYGSLQSIHEKAIFIQEYGEIGAKLLAHCCCDIETAQKAIEEHYQGKHISLADYAQRFTEDTSEVPKHLEFYIDYERMGRDWEMLSDIYTIETAHDEVHVFWNH